MKKILVAISLLVAFSSYGKSTENLLYGSRANQLISGATLVRIKNDRPVPDFVKFQKGKELPVSKLESWFNNHFSESKSFNLKLIEKQTDKLGYTHYRYIQTYNGVEAKFAMILAHAKNGLIESVNGVFFTDFPNQNINVTEQQALNKALQVMGANTYKWQVAIEEEHLKRETNNPNASYFPKGTLTYINKNGNPDEALHLCYKFNIYAQDPLGRKEIYIDVTTGEKIWEENKIHHVDAVGTAVTGFSGNQTITTDDTGTNYRLRETGRGNGIETYNCQTGTSYGSAVDFTDADNFWNNVNAQKDQFATDAHWGAEMTYDYYLSNHSRNSIDGNGFKLLSYVHYDVNYGNAFWDGQRMTYGDGSNGADPFTALDIAGHEITHGLTTFTANLVYNAESGALNESFSDIFGVSIEWFGKPASANWLMGEDIGFVIRSMSNPNAYNDPDTYFGNYWASLTGGDNGGVHTNSGVQNFWYYLMVNGGTGTNDNGDSYNVTGQGLTKASQIAFRNLTVYLTSSSEYIDARFYAIQSASDLFGGCSPEVETTTNAWYAVGVGGVYVPNTVSDFSVPYQTSCSAPFTVNFNNLSVNGNTFNWDFGDGNTSTQNNPTHTYTNYGTYTVELIADGGVCGIDTTVKVAYITIDSNMQCIAQLPTSGTGQTQTGCSGTLYDSGGQNGNYGANEDAEITISPTGASTVDLTFVTFDIEAGQNGSCNYDYLEIYDGPNTASPLIGTYCNNNVPTTVSSTGGSITLKFHSDPGVEQAGFEVNWSCNMPNQAPVVDFIADVDTTCTGEVNFTDQSTNGPTSWAWDFGDGNNSTQQNPSHVYTSNGLYTVQLTATNSIGSNTETKTNYIYVNLPAAPSANGDSVCTGSPATLTANGSGTINWYSSPTSTTVLDTGNVYVTGNLSSSTTFYAQDVVPNQIINGAKPDNTGGGANFNNYQYLIFDVYQPMELVSVYVYAAAAGNRTIELRDASGTVLDSRTVNIPNGNSRVYLNFNITPGTNYQLGLSSSSAIDLYRNNNGVNYPYTTPGLFSIIKSSASTNGGLNHYYFFYDWEVREAPCKSPRVPVLAFVDICSGIADFDEANTMTIFPNPTSNLVNFNIQLNQKEENVGLMIYDVNGRLIKTIYHNQTLPAGNTKINIAANDLESGIYQVVFTSNNYKKTEKLVILK